ncbi:MAG TPA: APC family permease [Pyrinomonadaceae bacterium]
MTDKTTEQATAALPREMNLRDLVLFNLAALIGLTWVSTAARAGPSAITLWLVAALLFFIPQGLAVVELSSHFPDEGGIYAWTKRQFGVGHGFLCGWCYWINNVLFYPSVLFSIASLTAYAIDPGGDLSDRWTFILPFTLIMLWAAATLNAVGVGRGKWLQNCGGASTYVAGAVLIAFGLYGVLTAEPANAFTLESLRPSFADVSSLNFWATIAFAFAGLELSSTMGSEIKEPRRNLPLSIYIAAPLAALLYILGTGAVLWYLPAGEIEIIPAPFQAIAVGAARLSASLWWLAPAVAALAAFGRLGGLGAWLTGSARVAFTVGLDRYFPAAFGRVHPRWRTPHVAIFVQAAIATLFVFFAVLGRGTTVERAFLVLIDMSLLIYFIPYVYLFLCFILHLRRTPPERVQIPGGRMAGMLLGVCGLLTTLFAMAVALIPPPDTPSPGMFILKVGGGSLLIVLVSGLIYWRARHRRVEAN